MRALLLLCLLLLGAAAQAAGDPAYLAELQARARTLDLAARPAWQRLLHLQPRRWPRGAESTLDFPGFFLAAEGKTDPRAELDASLATFFDDSELNGEARQCRFKARYEWLKSQLDFDPARLPPADCPRFDEWFAALNTGGLTLVFAANDLNSPSSMFGHTLLRLDAQGLQADERLLAYAVNYAAETSRDAGFLYAVKGLTGFYQGRFSVMPYYEKVKEYERFEHRDLWEYPLHVDEATRRRVLWHLWELRGVGSDYYFFTENCSFQLLSLLEAADPGLTLTPRFRRGAPYAIPIDTVRALQDAGILGLPVFRPANAHRLQHEYGELAPVARAWALDYAEGRAELADERFRGAPAEQQAGMLEVAHDKLYFEYQARKLERGSGLARARPLLAERSRNPAGSPFSPVPRPDAVPDQGHRSGRWSLGTRVTDSGAAFALFGLRPAYHDRLDPPQGYLAGGEIEFLAGEASLDAHRLRLDRLRILNVQAIAARDALFQPLSWFATGGLDHARPLADDPGATGGFVDGGFGLSWALQPGLQTYSLGLLALQVNDDVARGYDLAGGLRLGAAAQLWSPLSLELSGDALGGVAGAQLERLRLRGELQWQRGVVSGLRLGGRYERRGETDDSAVELRWMQYF